MSGNKSSANNCSVIDILLRNDDTGGSSHFGSPYDINKSISRLSNDFSHGIKALYFAHGYAILFSTERINTAYELYDKTYLLVVKDRMLFFHQILEPCDGTLDLVDVKIPVNRKLLNTESVTVDKGYILKLQILDFALVVEFFITIDSCEVTLFVSLQKNNKCIVWGFDPRDVKIENDDTELVMLDSSSLRDFLDSSVTKYIKHERRITDLNDLSTQVISYLSEHTNFCGSLGFEEFIQRLCNVVKVNVAKISQLFVDTTYEIVISRAGNFCSSNGLCIDKCYLDDRSAKSILSYSYLDDAIIDFFNEFTQKYIMKRYQKRHWIILNTFFLRKILQYDDSKEAYKNTWRWTRKYKHSLSLYDFIFIPMNQHGIHWSLIIIAYPKFAIRNKNKRYDKKASIIHLDSLGISKLDNEIFKMLKNYLYHEFENKCKELRRNGFEFICDDTAWESIGGSRYVPLQQNGHDCGVYVIEYINHLITHPFTFKQLIPKYFEGDERTNDACCKKWFTQNQINNRRINMKEMLVFMKKNPEWSYNVDSIKFLIEKMLQKF